MDLENMSPGRAQAEDNGETENDSALSGKRVDKNGSVVDNHSIELLPDVNGKGTEPSVSVTSSPSEMKPKKGYGLKKWRRIKRDITGGWDSSLDTGKTMMHEPSSLVTNPSKRTQVYVDRQKKSGSSVSSLNPMVGDFGAFVGLSVDSVGMDCENGDDQSSRSSTAASFPRMKFPLDKVKMGNLGGNDPSLSGEHAQAGKGRAESTKKARGELAKMEKENSPSSMESNLRSSNFLFVKGNHAMSNGVRGENGHEVQDCHERQFGNGGDDLSWDSKKERGKNHGASSNHDPLLESMCWLTRAQEALEEEVLKFKEIGKDGIYSDITDFGNESKGEPKIFLDLQSKEVEIAEAELEELFKQKIEAEVEYLAISRTVRRLRADVVDQNTVPFYQMSTASELTRNGLGDSKDVLLEKDDEKLQSYFEGIDSTLKLQKSVCKYTLCILVQLLLLFIMFTVFRSKISLDYPEVVPT